MGLACFDHEFRHNIFKVIVDPRGDTRPSDYFYNVMTEFIASNRSDARKADINMFFYIYNNKLSALARCMNIRKKIMRFALVASDG